MTLGDAFFDELESINADLTASSARIDQIRSRDDGLVVVTLDDKETLEAIALFQATQKRLSALLDTVED